MNDLEFVRRCTAKDKQSWDEFIRRYSRLIYNYIHSVLKLKGAVISEVNINDLFQGIFLSLVEDNYKKLKSFAGRNGCSLASWLRQVTVNYTIDYLRRLKVTVSLDEEDEDDFSLKETLADGSASSREALRQREEFYSLRECISRLQREEKYFLELYINRGLNLEEIKRFLKVSRGAVDMRKLRIIDKLRECFKSKGFLLDS